MGPRWIAWQWDVRARALRVSDDDDDGGRGMEAKPMGSMVGGVDELGGFADFSVRSGYGRADR